VLDRQTRTLPKAGRWLIAAFAVVVICHAGTAHAAASATDLNNPGYMTTAFQAFVTKINTAINATLGPGTPYIKWARPPSRRLRHQAYRDVGAVCLGQSRHWRLRRGDSFRCDHHGPLCNIQ
jgi:hypothetical protein